MDEYAQGSLLKLRSRVFAVDVDSGQGKWIQPKTPVMVLAYESDFGNEKLFFLCGERRYFIEGFDFALCFVPCNT